MPKPTKLHSKGKTSTIQKPFKPDSISDSSDPEAAVRQFQLELCWCIQQLEQTLAKKQGTEKQLQEAWKVLTVLKNNNQPIVRRRQLMRTHLGDYRAKMTAEEKKLAKMASETKMAETPAQPKATFIRKSAFQTTGDNSFRFDFKLTPEQQAAEKQADATVIVNSMQNMSVSNDDFKFKLSNNEFKFNFNVEDN